MQIALAIFRFVSLTLMMVTSIYAIYSYPSPEADARSPSKAPFVSEGVVAFDWSNLGLVFPIAIYSQIFHHSVPGLSHPLSNKSAAPRIFSGVLVTTMVLYSALGMTVAFYYGGYIPQTCTIAWANYTGGHDAPGESKPAWANFISYLVVLFPPIDIVSAFPLNAITLGNNLLCAFVEDERKQQMKRYKIPFRLMAAVPPICGAMVSEEGHTRIHNEQGHSLITFYRFPFLFFRISGCERSICDPEIHRLRRCAHRVRLPRFPPVEVARALREAGHQGRGGRGRFEPRG